MDQEIRNKLRNVVTQCRKLLEDSVSQELEGKYGIFAKKDQVTADPNAKMTHLTEEEQEARKDILDHFGHIKARGFRPKEALEQLMREIAFTHLNRLCAYKMMEAREVYVGGHKFREAVSRGINSNGVKFYLADHPEEERLFNTGHQDVAYRHFLDWLGGLLSDEIGVLFSPNDPANRLYPKQKTLDELLGLLNSGNIKPEETELRKAWPEIWSQDETIGWVYQYFTPKELRDQARKESDVPRNSYELAFRNQFFTPRYVVAFLSDNTLGRIWYEMRQGETKLNDQCRYMVRRPAEVFLRAGQPVPKDGTAKNHDLSQDELLKLPYYIPHRSKKDPRELKILDPACGSGHFLLYCFDLLLTIYDEAYSDPDLGPALRKDYPNLEDLRRDVPRLILARNLHGIDIDLRASQIAALAVWLRCQRAYQEMGVKQDRARIARSNLVCAEPMPGEEHMLKEFVEQIQPKLLGQLVEVVFEKMKLAGEAGSLLKIEDDIRDTVAEARKQWLAGPVSIQRSLFDYDKPVVQQQRFDFSGITDSQFFEQAETKVVDALRSYAEKAQDGQRLQRRLFTEDAVRGFAFVDLCHHRYNVVLMNPPFGDPTALVKASKTIVPSDQPNDMYCWFVARAKTLLQLDGLIGCITSSSFKTYTQYEAFRTSYIATPSLVLFGDLGWEVLDEAYVEAACYVLVPSQNLPLPTPFLDVRDRTSKQSALLLMVRELGTASLRFPADFHILASSPIIHEWPRSVLVTLSKYTTFGSLCRELGIGAGPHTFFYRLRWEVQPAQIGLQKRWAPFANGGSFSPFRREDRLLLEWEDSGRRIKSYLCEKYPYLNGNTDWKIQLENCYGTAGLTFGKKTTNFSAQVLPAGFIFSFEGIGVFPKFEADSFVLLSYLNSSFASWFLNVSCGLHKNPVYVSRLPVPAFSATDQSVLRECAMKGWKLQASQARLDETTSLFVVPRGLLPEIDDADHHSRLLEQIDAIVWKYIDIPPVNRHVVASEGGDENEEEPPAVLASGLKDQGSQTVSYALGAMFGRWDIRFATHQFSTPSLQDPFLALPVCSPGMLVGIDSLPATETPKDYPMSISWDGILPDDSDSADDVVRRIRGVFDRIWLTEAEVIEKQTCEAVGVKELREYFRKPGKGGFWDDHLSRYSKNRRKAPIYWLLQSSKKNYGLWLYYHRLNKDMLFKALVNYVEPKIRLERNRLEGFRAQQIAVGASGKEAKRLAKQVEQQDDFLSELLEFENKLRRAANSHLVPDLNDGVVLNIAPLHDLVPWKEAKNYWEDLLKGKYEWSSIGKQLRQKGLVK
jgi:hypothetical protein